MSTHLYTTERLRKKEPQSHQDHMSQHDTPALSPEHVAECFLEEIYREWKAEAPRADQQWDVIGE
jgi:hypothetical protein